MAGQQTRGNVRDRPERRLPRRRRGRGAAAIALAGLAAVIIPTTRQSNHPTIQQSAAVDAVASTAVDTAITLSMAVKPGEPVPLELVTEKSWPQLAARGYRGQGIDVALIDSGVVPVRGLDQPGKIIYGPDLSNEGGIPNLANLDTYGHGTHLAGIINGDDGDRVGGIAPDSRVVSVKVAGATGETNIAQVIAGIEWVIEHKNDNGLNIRVLNLSFGVDGVTTNRGDPLSAAVERAWDAGIVVVAAAGNRGNDHGGIDSPAISPFVIAVGAIESYDSSGTQDWMATWSSGGNRQRTPDLVAPGRSIMSFRVPGSLVDQTYPQAAVGDRYFLGSGTSQSTAIVSGFAAALLSQHPELTPDQLKYLLTRTAKDVVRGRTLDGSGKLDASRAARSTRWARRAPTQHFTRAFGDHVTDAGASWTGGSWNGASWSGGTWSGASWSGASWSTAAWSSGVWSGSSWSGATWSGATWSGATWSGATWSGATWSGATWSGATWSGATWSGDSWS